MTEITNEMVAEALGWKFREGSELNELGCWYFNGEIISMRLPTPDFLNDLNAAWKYVWPEIEQELYSKSYSEIGRYLIKVLTSKNPARSFCERLIEMNGK